MTERELRATLRAITYRPGWEIAADGFGDGWVVIHAGYRSRNARRGPRWFPAGRQTRWLEVRHLSARRVVALVWRLIRGHRAPRGRRVLPLPRRPTPRPARGAAARETSRLTIAKEERHPMSHDGAAAVTGSKWSELVGRLEQLTQSTEQLHRESGTAVPEWPTDRARIVRVALHEAALAVRRARKAAAEGVELARLAAFGLALAIGCVAADAAEPRRIGSETVGQFRTWSDEAQAFYVGGALGRSAMLGSRCAVPTTVGEYQAALVHDARFKSADVLAAAVFLLEIRNGCEWAK